MYFKSTYDIANDIKKALGKYQCIKRVNVDWNVHEPEYSFYDDQCLVQIIVDEEIYLMDKLIGEVNFEHDIKIALKNAFGDYKLALTVKNNFDNILYKNW